MRQQFRAQRAWLIGWLVLWAATAAVWGQMPSGSAATISLPPQFGQRDTYFFKEFELSADKIQHAWTGISATDFVLYVNGRLAARSEFGRVPSAFRVAEEVVDLASFLKPGRNTFVFHSHIWSLGTPQAPATAAVRMEGAVYSTGSPAPRIMPLVTDDTWVASFETPAAWTQADFRPTGWVAVKANPDPAGRLAVRIPKDQKAKFMPEVPPPLGPAIRATLPGIGEASDWSQQVVVRDFDTEVKRLATMIPNVELAKQYAKVICNPPTHMGDSYSIAAYPIGNGWVWTAQGAYPFYNTGVVCGPEYQYPVQWNAGSTFAGDSLSITADGRPLDLRNQWLWKIRQTDVVVTAASDPAGRVVFYSVTFAPPDLKALVRIYAVANHSDQPLKNVTVTASIARLPVPPNTPGGLSVAGRTLVQSVTHPAMKAGPANTRTMLVGALDEAASTAAMNADNTQGQLTVVLGDVAPGASGKQLTYRVFGLSMWDQQPVVSDAPATLAAVRAKGFGLLDETVRYWRRYNAETTHLEAPGPWGRRVADFIDDQKMFVQTQQFARTGAVGPMSFFSDQWIRDACGPIKSFLCTGKPDHARRAIDYFYTASVANRLVLNWVGMDVDLAKAWPAVDDWSKISVHAGGGDHVSAEVPNWLILQHAWYVRYTGDLEPVRQHWGYLKRLYYGQFDNATDKIFRPDFKLPFHGDETFIYSGGEALWENRYDLQQNSYPGGNVYSADSSFEFVAAGDALVELGKLIGQAADAEAISGINARARALTEKYYWMEDLGFYAPGLSMLSDDQRLRYPMGNINANVLWSGYGQPTDRKARSNVERMLEYLSEDSGVLNPIVGYDVTVGMLQGQALHSLAAIQHPWAEKAFYALLQIAGDTVEFTEWMAPGRDFRTMYRANRLRPWEGGINLEALLYYLSGWEPDALHKRVSLTPRLPGGIYSPLRWDTFTLKQLPLAGNRYDLTITDTGRGQRTYALSAAGPETVTVTLNVLVPFAKLERIEVNGKRVPVVASEIYGQALAPVEAPLGPGQTLTVVATYQPLPVQPVRVEFKDFRPSEPVFKPAEIVVFGTATPPTPGQKSWISELSRRHEVLLLDAGLPTDPATFRAALLRGSGLNARMLILSQGAMHNRKPTFWWNPEFDEIFGTFLRRGGIVLEMNSGLPTSRHLARSLGGATFEVDYGTPGFALALDRADADLDAQFRWVDEQNLSQAGKWSAYWEGWYSLPYLEGGVVIKDHFFIWGEQEQPHGAMQFTAKAVPGKEHLLRIRTTPFPKKGFTLQVTENDGATWSDLETVWVPQPTEKGKNGWVDVFLTLPAKYVTRNPITFRLKAPKGSFGGIGYEPERLASTGAARIWLRDSLTKPPSAAALATRSSLAGPLGLPDQGLVAYSQGRIAFSGLDAVYRILGDSQRAAVLCKAVGAGFYVRSEVVVEESFSIDKLLTFVEALWARTKSGK